MAAPSTFASKQAAKRFLAAVQTDMLRGAYIDPRAGRVTLTEWSAQWLDGDPSKRATTRARDATVLRTHFLPSLGHRPVASLTPLDIRQVVKAMADRLSPATVRTNLAVLAALLNAAVEADLIVRSPVRAIKVAPVPTKARPTLSPEDLYRLARTVPERYGALILLVGMTGLRWSEAVGLTLGHVDFLRSTVNITATIAEVEGRLSVEKTKSRSSTRTLSLPAPLVDELAQHVATFRAGAGRSELVFTGPKGGPLRRSFAARVFRPAVEQAGLDTALTFHGLRHVATSFMVEDGIHPRVIQHRLGHATARLSQELYAHVTDDADRDAAARLSARFSGASGTQRARGGLIS